MKPSKISLENLPVNPTALNVVLAIVILAGMFLFTATVQFVLSRLSERFPARRLFIKRTQPVFQIGAYAAAAYAIIRILSPDQSSLFAVLGSMALALGLAAQNLIKDIIGGLVVLADRSFQVGDFVSIGPLSGEVTNLGLRSTKLLTPQNVRVTVPNSRIVDGGVANLNAGAVDCLVTTVLFVPVDTDLVSFEMTVRDAVVTSKAAYLEKPITVLFKEEPGRNQARVEVRAHVFDVRYGEAFASDLLLRIRHAQFEEARRKAEPKAAEALTLEQIDERARRVMAEQIMALSVQFARPSATGVR
jgi:small-conductance mechanosensitive channel